MPVALAAAVVVVLAACITPASGDQGDNPAPRASLAGCERMPGYIYWWHSDATHRLPSPGHAPYMEYGVNYANSSKVMPDLQKRIDAGDKELCVTVVTAVSALPGGTIHAGEDLHGGANATLYAMAAFLEGRGAVLEQYWDWEYDGSGRLNYPDMTLYAKLDGGGGSNDTYPYPKEWFGYKDRTFLLHQLKGQISARIPASLVPDLAARADVVAIDAYGKRVGTPDFMFFGSTYVYPLLWDMAAYDGPVPVTIPVIWAGQARYPDIGCPHLCPDEHDRHYYADGYHEGRQEFHRAWLSSLIKDGGGNITRHHHGSPAYMAASIPPDMLADLADLRILTDIRLGDGITTLSVCNSEHPCPVHIISQLGDTPDHDCWPPTPCRVTDHVIPIDPKYRDVVDRCIKQKTCYWEPATPRNDHGPRNASDKTAGGGKENHGKAGDGSHPCLSGRIHVDRPGRGDAVCVYPPTAELLAARGLL